MPTLDNQQIPYDDLQVDQYNFWGSADEYEHVSGVCVLPIAENAPTDTDTLKSWSPVVVVQLHAPYRKRTMSWKATKRNSPPVIPSPESTGKLEFVGGSVRFPGPRLETTMNSLVWEAAGVYSYVETCEDDPGRDGYLLTSQPWQTQIQDFNASTYGAADGANLFGAISKAGYDARVGVNQSEMESLNGAFAIYSTISWFPAEYVNSELVNGGPDTVYSSSVLTTG